MTTIVKATKKKTLATLIGSTNSASYIIINILVCYSITTGSPPRRSISSIMYYRLRGAVSTSY